MDSQEKKNGASEQIFLIFFFLNLIFPKNWASKEATIFFFQKINSPQK